MAVTDTFPSSPEAWRWLRWQVWDEDSGWMPIPLESFGPVPAPQPMLVT